MTIPNGIRNHTTFGNRRNSDITAHVNWAISPAVLGTIVATAPAIIVESELILVIQSPEWTFLISP